jgi:hypothetical protein
MESAQVLIAQLDLSLIRVHSVATYANLVAQLVLSILLLKIKCVLDVDQDSSLMEHSASPSLLLANKDNSCN